MSINTENTITCKHPKTGEILTFQIPEGAKLYIDGYRTFHPVAVLSGGNPDDSDWWYRFLDNYNGPVVGRYDHDDPKWVDRVEKVVFMSFQDWKTHASHIILGAAKNPQYTMRSLIRQVDQEIRQPRQAFIEAFNA
jgi:hypothetical protein